MWVYIKVICVGLYKGDLCGADLCVHTSLLSHHHFHQVCSRQRERTSYFTESSVITRIMMMMMMTPDPLTILLAPSHTSRERRGEQYQE